MKRWGGNVDMSIRLSGQPKSEGFLLKVLRVFEEPDSLRVDFCYII
jgi:hypothetical protein